VSNGFTGMALTRFDILDVMPTLKVCNGYKLEGKIINYFSGKCTGTGKMCAGL